jgi:hypothetical protein
MLQTLHVKYPKESLTEIRERYWDQLDKFTSSTPADMPALIEDINQTNKVPALLVKPIAMMRYPHPMSSSDMIPALRGLSSWTPSESSTDTNMTDAASILGKRLASHTEDEVESRDNDRAVVVHAGEDTCNIQKKGRVGNVAMGYARRGSSKGGEVLEAISPGAANQLMGTRAAPRQKQ